MLPRFVYSFLLLQVFDVVINGDIMISSDLDIYEKVGRGVAHDEVVEFEVKDGKILWNTDASDLTKGLMRIEFLKVINVFFLLFSRFGSMTGGNSTVYSVRHISLRSKRRSNARNLIDSSIEQVSPLAVGIVMVEMRPCLLNLLLPQNATFHIQNGCWC